MERNVEDLRRPLLGLLTPAVVLGLWDGQTSTRALGPLSPLRPLLQSKLGP